MEEHATARCRVLPAGHWLSVSVGSVDQFWLRIQNFQEQYFKPFSLVEVDCANMLYLGEIENTDTDEILIRIRHIVDQRGSAWLRKVWAEPGI